MSHRYLSMLLTCSLLAADGIMTGCGHKQDPAGSSTPPVVRVISPTVNDRVIDYEYFTGRTDAVDSVEIRARVTGYLVNMPFKEGSEVKKGDLLFEIDPRQYQATLDRDLGQVKLAEARLKLAIADYKRGQEIAKTPGAISQQDLDKFLAAQSEADAALFAAKANTEGSRLNVEFTKVTSPIDGQVGRYLLTLGNLVSQDQTLLTTVVSVDPMYAYFDVDERTMLRVQQLIREGKVKSVQESDNIPLELGLANEGNDYPHAGVINFVNNQINASTGTLQVRGKFDNPKPAAGGPRLLGPGMFVRVRVPIGPPHRALLVPQAAIGTDQGQKFLLVVDDKHVVEYRPVNLGPQQSGAMQVIEPIKMVRTKDGLRVAHEGEKGEDSLQAGAEVIFTGLQRIRPGMTVTAKKKDEE